MGIVTRLQTGRLRAFLDRARVVREPSIILWRVAPLLLALGVVAEFTWLRGRFGLFWSATLWAVTLLVSYVGWGRFLAARLYPGVRLGWGFDGALGMALSLFFGGTMMTARAAKGALIVAWIVGGIVVLIFETVRRPIEPPRSKRWLAWIRTRSRLFTIALGMSVLGALLLCRFLASIANIDFTVWDDNMAYRGFPQQILDTGTLIEPFSYHRIGSLCGQSYLDAMALVRAGPQRLHMIDDGICFLFVAALIVGYEGVKKTTRVAIVLALVYFIAVPHRPHNIQAAVSGVALFLAMFRLFDASPFTRMRPLANAIVVGLLAAAVCTLRQNYMSAIAAFVAFYYASLVVSEKGARWRWLIEMAAVAFATVLFLAPWAIVTFQTAHTFFYPVMRGTTNPDFGVLGKVSLFEELRWIIQNFFYPWPLRSLPLFGLAAATIPFCVRTRALHALFFGTIAGFISLVHFFQAFDLIDSVARYYFAFATAFALAVTLKAGEERPRRGIAPALAIVAVGVVWQVCAERDKTVEVFTVELTYLEQERDDKLRAVDTKWLKSEDFYRRMQATVPEGERLLVMVDETFRFDGKRNRIWNFDQPGAMSPRPGVPYFAGAEAYASYFQSIGVRYIAFTISESSPEYTLSGWTTRFNQPIKTNGRGQQYKTHAKYYLDAFEALATLATTRKNLFHENDNWVIDLATR